MDVKQFIDELTAALATGEYFVAVTWHVEGPVVQGRAYVSEEPPCFLRFYFNEQTGTTAFAFVRDGRRIWGIDFDNRRGWHLHPANDPSDHISIKPLSVREIIEQFYEDLGTNLI